MPELPEVETVRRGITPHVVGKTILDLVLRVPGLRLPLDSSLCKILPGQVIRQVLRRGKYLLLTLDQGGVIIHLGMSGVLRILPAGTSEQKHDHVDLIFVDGTCLRFTDPRRFGLFIYSSDDLLQHPLVVELGPEPLEGGFQGKYLYQLSRGKKLAVKNFIMDQKVVVGVGNIYANEALFRSGIHPTRCAGKVSRSEYQQLVTAVKEVLTAAIACGGTTISDFSGSDGRPGYFHQELLVYGRGSQPCFVCSRPVLVCRLGQRSTYYCDHCQR